MIHFFVIQFNFWGLISIFIQMSTFHLSIFMLNISTENMIIYISMGSLSIRQVTCISLGIFKSHMFMINSTIFNLIREKTFLRVGIGSLKRIRLNLVSENISLVIRTMFKRLTIFRLQSELISDSSFWLMISWSLDLSFKNIRVVLNIILMRLFIMNFNSIVFDMSQRVVFSVNWSLLR